MTSTHERHIVHIKDVFGPVSGGPQAGHGPLGTTPSRTPSTSPSTGLADPPDTLETPSQPRVIETANGEVLLIRKGVGAEGMGVGGRGGGGKAAIVEGEVGDNGVPGHAPVRPPRKQRPEQPPASAPPGPTSAPQQPPAPNSPAPTAPHPPQVTAGARRTVSGGPQPTGPAHNDSATPSVSPNPSSTAALSGPPPAAVTPASPTGDPQLSPGTDRETGVATTSAPPALPDNPPLIQQGGGGGSDMKTFYQASRGRPAGGQDDTYLLPQPLATPPGDRPPPPPAPRPPSRKANKNNDDKYSRTLPFPDAPASPVGPKSPGVLPGSPSSRSPGPRGPKSPRRLPSEGPGEGGGGGGGGGENDPPGPSNASVCQSDGSAATSTSSGFHDYPLPSPPPRVRPLTMSQLRHAGPDPDQGFEEEEQTLEFEDDEDDVFSGSHGQPLYQEYRGEDFSQYLQDDWDQSPGPGASPGPPPPAGPLEDYHTHTRRRLSQQHPPPTSPNLHNSHYTSDRDSLYKKNTNAIKQRISKIFTLSRSGKNRSPKQVSQQGPAVNDVRVHNFSFADSKIGSMALSNVADASDYGQANPNPLDTRESRSELGLPKSWWKTDTLSARSLRSHMDTISRAKRASSMPDILDEPPRHSRRSRSNSHDRDSQASRQGSVIDSKGRKSNKGSQIWNKITRTLRGKDKLRPQHSVDSKDVDNSFPASSNNVIQDIRL